MMVTPPSPTERAHNNNHEASMILTNVPSSRRSLLHYTLEATTALTLIGSTTIISPAFASTTDSAQVTDKIFIDIKGLGGPQDTTTKRIVIGLFGKDAPTCTKILKQLVSPQGYMAPCKPLQERTLQKEQLEAKKVYNSCIESKDKGVNYDFATIWRVIKNERIDLGAVTGKFISREYPNWQDNTNNGLKHDIPGIVSVRRGNESGFGFTIYPGGDTSSTTTTDDLDTNHIVVGKILEGMDVVETLNQVPVITTSKVNYMGLTGGTSNKDAPSRACQYGGAMYCNEYKPLIKLTIQNTGII